MIKFFLIICFLFTVRVNGQYSINEPAPLQKGNYWLYQYYSDGGKVSFRVVDSTVEMENNIYYLIESRSPNGPNLDTYYRYNRIDSNGYYFRFYPSFYINKFGKYYEKEAGISSQWINETTLGTFYYKILDTTTTEWMGNLTKVREMEVTDSSLFYQLQYWSDDFGLLQTLDFEAGSNFLAACVIDGKVYGDTSITAIKEINTNMPEKFLLYQNYPNPFNPKTNIEFNIPQTDFITLKVYDILGKEVAVLIEKEMAPGKYTVEFNGNELSSGVYIYSFNTTYFAENKKMVLMN